MSKVVPTKSPAVTPRHSTGPVMPRRSTGPVMPRIVAHRGASGNAPENTLAAIRQAAEQGAKWIEIDVNTSSDGVAVLHHDGDLRRCSNGNGLVIETPLVQLKTLDSGSWFSDDYIGEPIATLDECLDLSLSLDLSINLEIKPSSGWELPTTERIAETLLKRPTLPSIVISSFSSIALLRAAELAPDIPRASLFVVAPPDWATLTREVDAINIHLHANSLLNKQQVAELQQAGLGVYCYTVNTTADAAKLFDIGVDGVISNFPGRLLAGEQ